MATKEVDRWLDPATMQVNFIIEDDNGVQTPHAIPLAEPCPLCGREQVGAVPDVDAHIQATCADRDAMTAKLAEVAKQKGIRIGKDKPKKP